MADELDQTIRFTVYRPPGGLWWVTKIESTTTLVGTFEDYDDAEALADALRLRAETTE